LSRSALLLYAPRAPSIYTLSLHDALPISAAALAKDPRERPPDGATLVAELGGGAGEPTRVLPLAKETVGPRPQRRLLLALATGLDRKSTRLNSSHQIISYAVFCLKKKNE